MTTTNDIDALVERITPALVSLRRALHQKPELAFEEHALRFLRNVSRDGEYQCPRELGGRVAIRATQLGVGNDDAAFGCRSDVERAVVEARHRKHLQLRQRLDQLARKRRPFPQEADHFERLEDFRGLVSAQRTIEDGDLALLRECRPVGRLL